MKPYSYLHVKADFLQKLTDRKCLSESSFFTKTWIFLMQTQYIWPDLSYLPEVGR